MDEFVSIILLADLDVLQEALFCAMASDLHNGDGGYILQVRICGKRTSGGVGSY